MIRLVIGLAVVVLILAIILPIALNQFFATDTSSWDANSVLIWAVIPVVVLLVVILALLARATSAASGFALPLVLAMAFIVVAALNVSIPVAMAFVATVILSLGVMAYRLHSEVRKLPQFN